MDYTSEAMESDRFEVLNCKGVPFSMRVRPVGGEKARVEWFMVCAYKLVGERILLSIFVIVVGWEVEDRLLKTRQRSCCFVALHPVFFSWSGPAGPAPSSTIWS